MAALPRLPLDLPLKTIAAAAIIVLIVVACGDGDDSEGLISPAPVATPTATSTPVTPTPSPEPTPTATAVLQPVGFPIAPDTVTGIVQGAYGSRTIAWGEGPTAEGHSRDYQADDDPVLANAAGWNCRVHVEYEGQPALDWYVPVGTPILATMDGNATLYAITMANAFDYYAVDREPYLGNPDRSRAALRPFPGPGGGMGTFVRIENEAFRVDYGHFELGESIAVVPGDAWLDGFGPDFDFASAYAAPRDYRNADPLARWPVRAGDVIGYSGDAGYSEAPHLHYVIRRQGSTSALCPTNEPGFEDRGWLWR